LEQVVQHQPVNREMLVAIRYSAQLPQRVVVAAEVRPHLILRLMAALEAVLVQLAAPEQAIRQIHLHHKAITAEHMPLVVAVAVAVLEQLEVMAVHPQQPETEVQDRHQTFLVQR
jgi:hypothetical protein